jgi:Carboxypeptidase regulatory-like domain/Calx-beta domain
LDGTAISPSDYPITNGVLNFAVGETELTVNIPIPNDSIPEDIEEFTFRLKSPANGILNPTNSSAKVKIFAAQFTGSSSLAIMGTAGSSNQAVIFPNASLLPATSQIFTTLGMPTDALPHGVTYFGQNGALISDFQHSRILVVNVSGAFVQSIINTPSYTGMGTISISPDFQTAFAMGSSSILYKISAPFNASSTITTLILPGEIRSYQTQAIVFNNSGRAFVYTNTGISVIDPPYNSIAFTIPVSNPDGGAIAISPIGNTLLTTDFGSSVKIFQAPFSAASTPAIIDISGSNGLDGIMIAPNGQKAIVVSAFQRRAWAISAPFTGNLTSNVEEIPLPASTSSNGFEDVGISADSQVAIITGNELGNSPPVFIKAPFGSSSQTYDVPISGAYPGRGAGAVRFLPPSLAPTASNATISGRVTLANGRGLARTRVTITNQNGVSKSVSTNPFGYFRFADIEAGQIYIIQPRSKLYQFEAKTLSVDEDLDGVNFVPLE